MPMIYEFACQQGHEFQLWSDTARLCPECGSEYLKRIFKTPPMIGTDKPAKVDALVRREFDARGITNIQGGGHEGDKEKVSYKSTPAELAAAKIEKDFPQMKDPTALQAAQNMMQQRWGSLGVKGVINSGLANQPGHEAVKSAIINAGRNDRKMIARQIRKDPENLQVKRG